MAKTGSSTSEGLGAGAAAPRSESHDEAGAEASGPNGEAGLPGGETGAHAAPPALAPAASIRATVGVAAAGQRDDESGGGLPAQRRHLHVLGAFGLGALAACLVVAAMTAAEVGGAGGEEGDEQVTTAAAPRRASGWNASSRNDTGGTGEAPEVAASRQGLVVQVAASRQGLVVPVDASCRKAISGEPCFRHVTWAMDQGINLHPEWYPGLTPYSSFADFQKMLASTDAFAECPRPCGMAVAEPSAGVQYWCAMGMPQDVWQMKDCKAMGGSQNLKVLTYNLFWWNLFGRRGGNGGSAGSLLRDAGASWPFDIMAFQEADEIWWPLSEAGLTYAEYSVETSAGLALAVAWRHTAWRKLAVGTERIAEDRPDQWYGRRGVLWVRLQSYATGRTVLFANHHGPLPVSTGGICGGRSTAYNLLGLLQRVSGWDDVVILTGDFNAISSSDTVRTLQSKIHHVFQGSAFGGVDHFFSNCAGHSVAEARNLGSGGSDHDALMVIFRI